MRTLLRFVSIVLFSAVAFTAITVAGVPYAAQLLSARSSTVVLPDLLPLPDRSQMFDVNGQLIANFSGDQNRKYVSLTQISQPAIDAVLAVEDETFYRHNGVNVKSVARAALTNFSAGDTVQGGSTITQQVVKLGLVGTERTAKRKLKEAMWAHELEKHYTKNQILEHYLNAVYLGNGAYGIEAAAELYFGKAASALDFAEGALLAGLIRNPTGYDPFRYPARSKTRRLEALKRLQVIGKISALDVIAFDAEPVPDYPKATQESRAPDTYFVDEAKKQLLNDDQNRFGIGKSKDERRYALFNAGLRIYTAFDPVAQQLAENAVRDQIPTALNRDGKYFTGALASVDPGTGAIKAMVGGPGFSVWKYNLAVQAQRQPGSSFKTIVLVAALEAGVRPDDLIDGTSPCDFTYDKQLYHLGGHGSGQTTLQKQLNSSINCAFVRLGLIVGLDRVIDTARRLGIEKAKLQAFPSLSIGTIEVSPLEMAEAYATLAAGGVHREPYYIAKIVDRYGKTIYDHGLDPGEQAIKPEIAAQAAQMLQGVVTAGTGKRAAIKGRQVAGKTGTTNDSADAWFVGFTPQLSTAVWMGSPFDRTPMEGLDGSFGEVFGGTYPALVWQEYTSAELLYAPALPFAAPPKDLYKRGPAFLVLPGTDCWFEAVAPPPTTAAPGPVDPNAPSTSATAPSTTAKPKQQKKNPFKIGVTIPGVEPRYQPVPSIPARGWTVIPCSQAAALARLGAAVAARNATSTTATTVAVGPSSSGAAGVSTTQAG